MSLEKQNVVNEDRTPRDELLRKDADWDKEAASKFLPKPDKQTPGEVTDVQSE